jgi:glycosyltransferase involved in cell wall biosynthesis
MRIALVTTSWPRDEGDPAGHFVRAEARQLERAGHEVVVVAPRAGGAFGWPGVAARVRERAWRALDAVRWTVEARARVARLEVHRVVAHWAVPCAWPIGVAAEAELEVVSHGGDVRLLVAMPRPLRERVVSDVAGRAASWRFVSHALKARLTDALGDRARARVERVASVAPCAIEVPDVEARAATIGHELAAAGRARVAVSVGRLVASKRVDRAIDHVARTRDVDALVVVGDGPEREHLEALAKRRGVAATFTGALPRDEALAWMRAAHVLLFASEEEGASTVLREAEALGTPVTLLV